MRVIKYMFLWFSVSLFAGDNNQLVILFTNNINGNFENCLCTDHPLGSLEKMKPVIDSLRATKKKILLLDAGDFSSPFGDSLRDKYLYEIGHLMNYDAMAVGDQEFSNGVNFFLQNNASHKLPFISCNLKIDQKQVFPSCIEKQYGNIKVLVISAIFPDVFKFYDENKIKMIDLADPLKTIRDILKEKSADLIILLSHNGLDNDQSLAKQLPEINFIIGAHTQDHLTEPIQVGNTSIFQSGSDGFYLGQIEVQFEAQKIPSFNYHTIPIELGRPNDPEITSIIQKYHFEKNRPVIEKGKYLSPISNDFEIKASENCGKCHKKEYAHWRTTRHAQSFKSIEKNGKTKLLKCLSCHVSGFSRVDGYVNLNITPKLNSVNCTECHYTQSGHISNPQQFKTVEISSETCMRCHDKENDPDFKFETSLKQISHMR
jgi:2',3'-cyclic-nucleotide 2'-phosphodiesterase (5'-nucleotidase family)